MMIGAPGTAYACGGSVSRYMKERVRRGVRGEVEGR